MLNPSTSPTCIGSFNIGLEDIARQIGDTHKTVQRLYRGLMVIEQAERMKVFSREDRWYNHFSFSHLYAGINYPGISGFIGLRPETDEHAGSWYPAEKGQELRELCLWLYGSKREDDTPPVIQTQNPHLRQLDAVVANREALAALTRIATTLTSPIEASQSVIQCLREIPARRQERT